MTTTLCRTPRPRQHVGEIRRRERLREPPCFDCKAGAGAVRGEYQKQNIVLGVHPIGCHLQGRGQAFDRCTSASLRVVLHLDRAVPEAVRYDLRCAGRLAFKHALIPKKAERHYAHLASILNGMRRGNRRREDQNKSDERRASDAANAHVTIRNHVMESRCPLFLVKSIMGNLGHHRGSPENACRSADSRSSAARGSGPF